MPNSLHNVRARPAQNGPKARISYGLNWGMPNELVVGLADLERDCFRVAAVGGYATDESRAVISQTASLGGNGLHLSLRFPQCVTRRCVGTDPMKRGAVGGLSHWGLSTGANRSENVAALLSRAAASDDEIRV
jgi:hypothetical protein